MKTIGSTRVLPKNTPVDPRRIPPDGGDGLVQRRARGAHRGEDRRDAAATGKPLRDDPPGSGGAPPGVSDGARRASTSPLAIGSQSEPEPDVAVVKGTIGDFVDHPTTAVLVAEVSGTTLRFDRRKG